TESGPGCRRGAFSMSSCGRPVSKSALRDITAPGRQTVCGEVDATSERGGRPSHKWRGSGRSEAILERRRGKMAVYVQKVRVPGRLSQPNQESRDGWFLLYPEVEGGGRSESLVELLNSTRGVIPFLPAQDTSVVLLTRLNLDWVIVGSGVEPSLVFPPN